MIWMLWVFHKSHINPLMEKGIVSSLVKSLVNVNYILVYTFVFLFCNEASIFILGQILTQSLTYLYFFTTY